MATQPSPYVSVEEYLRQEANSLERHEYSNGEVFARAGGTLEHSRIGANIVSVLVLQLADSDCFVGGPDTRIRTSASGLYSYADAVVSCGTQESADDTLLNPVLIVEVLSPTTESYDRGVKFEKYRQIESFCEYVVVAQDHIYVEHHVRDGSVWIMRVFTERDSAIVLNSVPASLQLSFVYAKVL